MSFRPRRRQAVILAARQPRTRRPTHKRCGASVVKLRRSDRRDGSQALQPVKDEHEDVLDAAVLQVGEHAGLELWPPRRRAHMPQAHGPSMVTPRGEVDRSVNQLAVADLDADSVDEDYG